MTQEEKDQALSALRSEMETNQARLKNAEYNVAEYLRRLEVLTTQLGEVLAQEVSA